VLGDVHINGRQMWSLRKPGRVAPEVHWRTLAGARRVPKKEACGGLVTQEGTKSTCYSLGKHPGFYHSPCSQHEDDCQ